MFEFLGILIVLGVFIGGMVLIVRMFTLPADIRRVREEFVHLKREVTALDARLAAATKKIDQLTRGEAPAISPEPQIIPVTSKPAVTIPTVDVQAAEIKAAEVFAEQVAPALFREPSAVPVPPPLPVAQPDQTTLPPVYAAAPAPSESAFDRVRKSIGPKDPNMTWEMALGTYWLPRLGAVAISTAIVFALSIGFQRWGAPARVAMGYGVAVALLGIGWWLDRKYPKYARVLFGAGFALTYFVTFATHFIEFAKISESPYPSLAGMAAIVVAWAGLAQRRKSPIIAAVAMLVGQFTIALASYSLADPAPYSIVGIVFLSVGGAFFLARNGWYAVAGLGLVASYANHFFLMVRIEGSDTVGEFITGMSVLSTYFLVYAAAEFFSPDAIRKRVPFWFRNAFTTFNSLMFLFYGTMTMQGYDFSRDVVELFHYPLAAALLGFSIAYLRFRGGDLLYNTYFVKGITVATLGLAMQFDAHTLTASFAIESTLLLFAARRTGLLVTRSVALAAGALAVAQGTWTLLMSESLAYGAEGYWPRAAEGGIVVAALLGAAWLYQRTDWSTRSPARTRFSDATNLALWQLDLVAAPPAGSANAQKPLNGILFPVLFTISAAFLYIGHAYRLTALQNWPLTLAIGAAALTLAAAVLRSVPFGAAALMLSIVTTIIGTAYLGALSGDGLWHFAEPAAHNRAIPMLALVALVALASEKRYLGRFAGLALHQDRVMSFMLYAAFTWLLGMHVVTAIASPAWVIAALVSAAVVLAAAAIPLHRVALAWCSTALIVWAAGRWIVDWNSEATNGFLAAAWIGIAAAFALERYFARLAVKFTGEVLVPAATAFFVAYVFNEVPPAWIAFGWIAGAAALLAYSGVFRVRTAAALGVLLLAAASLRQVIHADSHRTATLAVILGFAAAAALWIAIERTSNRLAARMNLAVPSSANAPIGGVSASVATILLVFMLYRLPQLSQYYLTISWSILAMALFGLAIGFREKLYRFCGLAVLALASLRVIAVDTRELELIQKVLAWGGLGIVLLILGFGYVKVFARNENRKPATDRVPGDAPASAPEPPEIPK